MRDRSRGTILVMAIFFLIVLSFISAAFLALVPTDMNSVRRERMRILSTYACEAGISDALQRIVSDIARGAEPALTEVTGIIGTLCYRVTITPDGETSPNGNSAVRVYTLSSNAYAASDPLRRLVRRAEARFSQESFARFAYFCDNWGSGYNQAGVFRVRGPFHINGQLRLSIPSGWYASPSAAPMFEGTVTSAYTAQGVGGDNVLYRGEAPYDGRGNPVESKYRKLYQGGRSSLATGVAPIRLPKSTFSIKNAAWGGTSGFPTFAGVYVSSIPGLGTLPVARAGLYISGAVDTMELKVVNGNAQVRVLQGRTETKVTTVTEAGMVLPAGSRVNGTISYAPFPVPARSTVKEEGGRYEVYDGVGNGTVYCTGDIRSLYGTNKGKRTVSVDVEAGRDIVITGNLLRDDTVPGEDPPSTTDGLGLVGYNVRIGTAAPRDLTIYSLIMAGRSDSAGRASGQFYVDSYHSRPAGNLKSWGSRIYAEEGYTYTSDWSGRVRTGFGEEQHYDSRLAQSPPPYFPVTGKFHLVSWKEQAGEY